MSNDLRNLTDTLERLTSELRTLLSQRHTLVVQQKRLVEHSVSLQREYAYEVDRTFSPMLAKQTAPAKPRLQG